MKKHGTLDSVVEMRRIDRDVTATEMADRLGVSRARIGQILKSAGLPTRTARSWATRADPQPQPRVITGGVRVPITASAAGIIGELLVAADLTARGYTVYAPICRHSAHADLIALRRGENRSPITFEVRCGRRDSSGGIKYARKPDSKTDHHAAVVTGEPVEYHPELLD